MEFLHYPVTEFLVKVLFLCLLFTGRFNETSEFLSLFMKLLVSIIPLGYILNGYLLGRP